MRIPRRLVFMVLLATLSGCATRDARQKREAEEIKQETNATELFAKGEASAAAGDMTRAEQYMVSALRAGGDERTITQRLLVFCAADQRYPVALDYADIYLRHHPTDTQMRFARASLYAATGERARAEEDLERVIAEKPEWADAHYELATVLREKGGALLGADRHYREYLKLSPNGAQAEAARGYLLKSVP